MQNSKCRYFSRLLIVINLIILFNFLDAFAQSVEVTASNAHEYKKVIPSEIYAFVSSGALVMPFEKDLSVHYVPNLQTGKILDATKAPSSVALFSIPELKSERAARVEAGRKLLWNIQALNWQYPVSSVNFSIIVQQEDQNIRQLEGILNRYYVWQVDKEDKTGQLFREKITINKPAALNNYTWLTFRFFGNDEDMLWVYSPVIKKSRELTGSNRSDSVAGTLAADDFLFWSGKFESLDFNKIKFDEVLIPFIIRPETALQVMDMQCSKIVNNTAKNWNFSSYKYPQAASWLPSNVIFTPRKVFKLDLFSVDPYSLSGRQTIYVDTKTMLPIYRFVYDRAGAFWKSILNFYAFATNKEGAIVPFIKQSVVLEHKKQIAMLVDYKDYIWCDKKPDWFKLEQFDPRHFSK